MQIIIAAFVALLNKKEKETSFFQDEINTTQRSSGEFFIIKVEL